MPSAKIEETPEGRAQAALTREAAKRKRDASDANEEPGKRARPIPVIRHDVEVPPGYVPEALDPALHGTLEDPQWRGEMAKTYPFVLDPFQQQAIACLERRENVLVAAHTSAGKTAVAEYAVAMALRDGQHVVYTSPLKALSNQKFRELSDAFGEVGLLTGDVTISPNAPVIVMTTEILRSMLYRGSEVLREVAWVIFDEVHYMQDRERGVVWEETIITLPPQIRMVFLSATLANATEFASWVAHLHKRPCHVVYTDFRPTPLQHYCFPQGGTGLYLIKDTTGGFREDQFEKMRECFKEQGAIEDGEAVQNGHALEKSADSPLKRDQGPGRGSNAGGRGTNAGGRGTGGRGRGAPNKAAIEEDIYKIVKLVAMKKLEPVIVFSFNRQECERYARKMALIDFNDEEEKKAVRHVFESALDLLSEEDRQLSAVTCFPRLLERGIAVHHSGLLPIMKEVIELLFQEHLVKALFATETFAMGLNMPARTCVFTAMQKWDGVSHRWMTSGEYIQMSGRAGRRGKDDKGVCIMMVDSQMDTDTCRDIVTGKPSPLLSSFRLSYYTLLNLLRRTEQSGHDIEYLIQRSFEQFQYERSLPAVTAQIKQLEAEAAALLQTAGQHSDDYARLLSELAKKEQELLAEIMRPEHVLHYLVPGRLLRVRQGKLDWGWGILVGVQRLAPRSGPQEAGALVFPPNPTGSYLADVLLPCSRSLSPNSQAPRPADILTGDPEMAVLPVPLTMVTGLSSLRVNLPEDLRKEQSRESTLLTLQELYKRYPDGMPQLDPQDDMGITGLQPLVQAIAQLEKQLAANPVFKEVELGDNEKSAAVRKAAELKARAEELCSKAGDNQLSKYREECAARSKVLRKLGHVSPDGLVLVKGQAACLIMAADELLCTEMMFNGTFKGLEPAKLVALVSCLIPTDKTNDLVKVSAELGDALLALQDAARRVAEASIECKVGDITDVDTYVESFVPTLMDIAYHWAKGESFDRICRMTTLFEGSIIRCFRRLSELLLQLASASHKVGDSDLGAKFEEADKLIRRDIIFAASLYV